MSVRLVNPANTYQINNQTRYQKGTKDDIASGSALRVYDLQEKAPTSVKVASFLGALGGIAGAMYFVFKKGKNLEGIKEMKGLKDYWHNLTHVKYIDEDKTGKNTFVIEKLIGALTAGSVGGGLIAGAVADKKENFGAKIREAVIQVVGNIATPLVFVVGGLRLYEKFGEAKIDTALKLTGKSKGIPKVVASGLCLAAGLWAGNHVGNSVNHHIFHNEEKRKIKLADLSPQIDDGCVAASIVASTGKIGEYVGRVIPAAMLVPGFSTGVAKEHHCKKLDECV
jgi:hypothetical protein